MACRDAADYKTKPRPSLALPDFRNLGTILRILLGRQRRGAGRRAGCASRAGSGWPPSGSTWPACVEPQLLLALRDPVRRAAAGSRARPGRTRRGVVAARHRRRRRIAVHAPARAVRRRSRRRPCCAGWCSRCCSARRCSAISACAPRRCRRRSPRRGCRRCRRGSGPHFLFNSINAVLSLIRTEPTPRRDGAGGHGRPLPRADARQSRSGAARRRGRAVPPVPGAGAAAAGRPAAGRVAYSTTCPATRWCRRWCCSRCSRTPSTTASSRCRSRAWSRSTSSTRAATCTRSCAIPTGPTAAATTPATRWRVGNVRERLALHFDAEASLALARARRRLRGAHPMPYRSPQASLLRRGPQPVAEARRG